MLGLKVNVGTVTVNVAEPTFENESVATTEWGPVGEDTTMKLMPAGMVPLLVVVNVVSVVPSKVTDVKEFGA